MHPKCDQRFLKWFCSEVDAGVNNLTHVILHISGAHEDYINDSDIKFRSDLKAIYNVNETKCDDFAASFETICYICRYINLIWYIRKVLLTE